MGSRDCRHLQGSPDGCLRPLSHARLRTMDESTRRTTELFGGAAKYLRPAASKTGSTAERFEAAALADELETDPGKNILPSAREIAAELDWELAPIPDL
uniref:Uncharacterized protein n=1 Tax=Oryza sativa subsp. japonica TaxID=39947 RepID=Q53KX2_ORYSJ|nr:Hypothetical protein [Oryza sativa Japonica Group]